MTTTRPADTPSQDDRALVASFLIALYVIGPTIGLLGLALPHAADANDVGFGGVVGASYLIAAILFVYRRRLPGWGIDTAAAAGTVLISASIFFSGSTTNTAAFYYLWVVLAGAYFLDRPRVAAQLAIVAVGYGVALALKPAAPGAVQAWIVSIGTLTVAAGLFVFTRERVAALVARLGEAADTDPLTGLLNRRGFAKQLELELERARRLGAEVSLVRRPRSLQAGQRPLRPPGW
jgi:hypothetical protein